MSFAPHSYRTDPTVPHFADDRPVIVFDGFCGLCSRVVQFVLRHDKARRFRFLPAQSELGTALYRHYKLDAESYETFILIEDGRPYFASDAGLRLFRFLGLPWSLLAASRILPRSIRDSIYFWLARNRMRFFGRSEACYLPTADQRERFLA